MHGDNLFLERPSMSRFARLGIFFVAVSGLCLAPPMVRGWTLNVKRLGEPVYADGEVSQDKAIPPQAADKLLDFTVTITATTSATNNVQIAFGRDDSPMDGELAAEETDLIIGWDRGAWFIRPRGLRERYEYIPSDGGETLKERTLKLRIGIAQHDTPVELTLEDEAGVFSFSGLNLDPLPDWINPIGWDLLRVTVRGRDPRDEDIVVRFGADGMVIILR
ncbi:MAG: hypothetical protein M0Q95_19830 [Porticoccaceae bacterium]|nr:hypothetical protein [Porticoccaceae bacterium]